MTEETTPTIDVLDGEPIHFVPMKFVDGKMFMWLSFCSAHQTYHPDCRTCCSGEFVEVQFIDQDDVEETDTVEVKPTMNIYAESGSKVFFANLNYGYLADRQYAAKELVYGEMYTVKYVDIGESSSEVCLAEKPDMLFNTVLFADVEKF